MRGDDELTVVSRNADGDYTSSSTDEESGASDTDTDTDDEPCDDFDRILRKFVPSSETIAAVNEREHMFAIRQKFQEGKRFDIPFGVKKVCVAILDKIPKPVPDKKKTSNGKQTKACVLRGSTHINIAAHSSQPAPKFERGLRALLQKPPQSESVLCIRKKRSTLTLRVS